MALLETTSEVIVGRDNESIEPQIPEKKQQLLEEATSGNHVISQDPKVCSVCRRNRPPAISANFRRLVRYELIAGGRVLWQSLHIFGC